MNGKFRCVMQRSELKLHLNTRVQEEDQPVRKTKPEAVKQKDLQLEQLARECRGGNRTAQKKLYDALAPKMFSLCIRYMGDRQSAEDVLQDGFVTLFTRLGSFSGEGSFEGWARKIFVNTALMSLRKTDILRSAEDTDAAWGLGSGDATAIQTLGYKELLKLISGLPAGFRTVFNMYVIEGWSHKEIAAALGITEGTSRSQLQRARMMLQERIKKK